MEHILSIAHNFFSFVVIISVIVFIHEFGHYWVAKKCGVKIEAFSIGFGPEIFGWNDASGTRWKIAVFPLGGYVKMFGDAGAASTPDQEVLNSISEEDKKLAFHYKPLSQKAAVVVAGPVANFLLAIIILAFFFMVYGKPHTTAEIGKIMPGSAAEVAGLQVGDLITELHGEKIARFEDLRKIASIYPDEEMDIVFVRKGKEISQKITPKLSETEDLFGNKVRVGLLGVASGKVDYVKINPAMAVFEAVRETFVICKTTLVGVGQIITGKRNSDEISGILRIGKYSGQATEKGFNTVLWFMAVLSINLGLINLFPIPLLDGGHLMYYLVEAIKGKPMAENFQQFGFRIGLAILITLMLFATFNDLKYFKLF